MSRNIEAERGYDANLIANYIVNYSIDQENPVTHLKLQKLLYYVQAAFLVKKQRPCYTNDIESWRHGPVVRDVYDNFKIYADRPINQKQTSYNEFIEDSGNDFKFKLIEQESGAELICEDDKLIINKVINYYKDENPWMMVKKTHEEDPWLNSDRDSKIPNCKILNYFKDNEARIYGES